MIRNTKNHHRAAWTALVTAGALCMALTLTPAAAAQDVIDVRAGAAAIDFEPTVAHGGLVLTVSGPDGFYHREEFGAGESASFSIFDQDGGALPDGSYTWELIAAPTDVQRREALEANRLESRSQAQGFTPVVESGSFAVIGGSLVAGGDQEPGAERPATAAPEGSNTLATKDFVVNDDLIVTRSACVGFDCVNGETFGFDTIRLKENNLRIKFEDTSTAGGFPTNDWELVANDSASGGASRFSILDVDASRNVFTVEANAPNNALYVESSGDVGIGTANPVLDLHIATGNTPALRLEQNTSSGFAAQIFDIASNEANFFVRDVTGGSALPFRIRPGAPTSSIDIAANGNVGVGTTAPGASLHVQGSDGNTQFLVEETSGTEAARTMFALSNNGVATFDVTDASGDGSTWSFETEGPSFRINKNGTGGEEVILRDRLDGTGNATMVVNGSVEATNVTFSSSRAFKTGFVPVDGRQVLEKIVSLPMAEWRFKDERNGRRHIGPVAEDFNAAFDLGGSSTTISVIDANGITMAALQGLHEEVQDKDARIRQLEERLAALEKLVSLDCRE